ncbi:glycosyl transferase family 1 [Micromonospora avicenniae]|uniref:glycosyl transferase family 1 n=1 Tax=Micromonospora avicenniae TaxID=1198245 RepID=UPI00332917B5
MTSVFEYPRVLVVGAEPFGCSTGTGITLSNLFDGWPRDRLAQVYLSSAVPSTEVCERFYRVDPRSAPVDHAIRRLTRRDGPAGSGLSAGAGEATGGSPAWRARGLLSVRAAADLSPLRVPTDLVSWVRRQRPEVIYSMLGSARVMDLVRRLAAICQVPVVPHFMDDWPSVIYTNGELLGWGRRATAARMESVISRAGSGLCISEPMAEEYRHRYGIPFAAFMNCVEEDAFTRQPGSNGAKADPGKYVEFVYVGGLHLGRWAPLARIGAAMAGLRSSLPQPRLTVHAPERDLLRYGGAFADLPAVRLSQPVASSGVPAVLQTADVLVHVESFAPALARYTRLSLSTKIPQYLAAGRPVLAHGPAELASMRHLRTAGAGWIVGEDDQELLSDAIRGLRGDPALRQRLGCDGYAYAKLHHAKRRVTMRFAEHLAAAAGGNHVEG